MNIWLIKAVLLAWVPLLVALFRVIGPGRAALVGSLGGFLFLPTGSVKFDLPSFAFPVDKWNMTGLGLILGVLIFDFRAVLRFRPNWLDLPMVAYSLAPLIGFLTGVPGASTDILDVMIGRGLGWVAPYWIGRLYFSQGDGPSRVAVALVISGLAYIPFCVYEEFAGPSRYLAGLIYGIPYAAGTVDRLGGFRPEVFLGHGLGVSLWMALTTVMATWLWLGEGWRPLRFPAWLPALSLLATTLSCRGVYGYIILTVGLATAGLTLVSRSRLIFIVLALIPVIYMVARASGLWDGGFLVQAAGFTGRAGTVAFRLKAEDEIIDKVLQGHPIFGFGNYIWHGELGHWPDGSWLHALWMGGLVGLILQLVTLYLLPGTLTLVISAGRPSRPQAMSPLWALAAWCLLQMIDGMHNTTYFPPVALIGGTLIGAFLERKSAKFDPEPSAQPAPKAGVTVAPALVVAMICWILIEILGQLPRSRPTQAPSATRGGNPPRPFSK